MLLYPFLLLNPPPESINLIAVASIVVTTITPLLAHQVARAIKIIPTIYLEALIEGSAVINPNVAFAHIQDWAFSHLCICKGVWYSRTSNNLELGVRRKRRSTSQSCLPLSKTPSSLTQLPHMPPAKLHHRHRLLKALHQTQRAIRQGHVFNTQPTPH